MKTFLPIALILAFVFKLSAEETNSPVPLKIGTSEASKYYGQEMTVTGRVAQVTIREKVTFLNLDEPYPNSPFTLVIFSSETNKFGNLKSFNDKNIEATGKIKNYRDKPEIILNSPSQLKVVKITN